MLIELLVVIAIIAILAALLPPALSKANVLNLLIQHEFSERPPTLGRRSIP